MIESTVGGNDLGSRRQNTIRKDRSKHFLGRAAKLASCLLVYSDRVNKSQFFNCNHLSMKNRSVKLPFETTK